MFCPNCGKMVSDGSKFCGNCGASLAELYEAEVPSEGTPDSGAAVPPQYSNVQPDTPPAAKVVTPSARKKVDKKLIGIAVAAVAVIVAVVFVIQVVFSAGGGGDNAYVYLSDGDYELVTNLNKVETIEIASSRSDYAYSSLLSFSPSGKYIYYYTKYDSSNGIGTLCRAEYGKLKADSGKNDNYIETIASNVSLGFKCIDDETVLYKNGDGTLYYYDGSESTQLAKSVNLFYTDGAERVVYSTGTYDEGYTLYGMYVTDPDSKVKLASNYYSLYNTDDFDHICYTKSDDDYNETLYVVGFDKDSEQLGKDVTILDVDDGMIYFMVENGETISLYDYVEDTYASADAGITEPDPDDYSIPEYSYKMVYGSNLSESDYDELYTTCTKDLYWYGESIIWSYSMEESLDIDWSANSDATHAATQSFIDTFAASADENGYILVTDEVKAALQEIQNTYSDDPEDEWMWLWLCYNKYQSGETIDDAYYTAYEAYEEATDRIDIRETLQDSENDYALQTIYCYANGTLTAVAENVLSTSTYAYTGAVLYNTPDMVTETIDMANVYSTSSVTSLFSIDHSAENYLLCYGSTTPVQISASAAEDIDDFYYDYDEVGFYVAGSGIYATVGDDVYDAYTYFAAISNGTVGEFSYLSDGVYFPMEDSNAYYAYNIYWSDSDDAYYFDLYQYVNGESKLLARDILLDTIRIYEDGLILAYTDYTSDGYELTVFDDEGKGTMIADDVEFYTRCAEGNILYISDGDLYSYDEGERTMIGWDVDRCWVLNTMEPVGYYYDY